MLVQDDAQTLASTLTEQAFEARTRTLSLMSDLDDEQLMGPPLAIVNPPLWEIGHVGWFQEFWNLRYPRRQNGTGERAPRIEGADELYNSSEVAHDTRWELPLPSRPETLSYLRIVLDDVLENLHASEEANGAAYFMQLATSHEDMHGEAFTYTRQTHGLCVPPGARRDPALLAGQPSGPLDGEVEVPGGTYMLGATPETPFVFDNEKWAHPVEIAPFRIARAPVTNAQFAEFVDGGGYECRELWSEEGWRWRSDAGAEHPVYWQGGRGAWQRRFFDEVEPLPPHQPVVHVNWHEAQAYCRWAGRRLPTEAEWELAASAEPAGGGGGFTSSKRTYPWGDEPPSAEQANLDQAIPGCVDVAAFPAGESAFGCRQMVGNVWELCESEFRPFPGFVVDPYREYSEPWMGGDHRVLRGGSWATPGRMLRNTWRNYAIPPRNDLFAGFRTCAA